MYLSPADEERLRVFVAAELARRTVARGLRLNAPEAVALACDEMHMAARAGGSFDQVLAAGRRAVLPAELLPGVADLVDEIGSLRPGRLADIVLWRPAHFGVRPELVLKGGWYAWGPIGAGNATVEGVEPRRYGSHWAGQGTAAPALSTTFVSASADAAGIRQQLGSRRRFLAVRGTRQISREALLANTALAPVQVDPADGTVSLGGRILRTEPVSEVPLSRRYLLG
jgi:urease gamma subunit